VNIAANSVVGLLICLLVIAAWSDIKTQRIPNWLVLSGIVIGLLANGLLPAGLGINNTFVPGGLGWLAALQGMGLGLAVLLPLYLLRAMGAGDVKLMGMAGAFLGPVHVQGAILFTLLAGGLVALMLVLWSGMLKRLLQNIKYILMGGMIKMSVGQLPVMDELPMSVGKLPYGVAIAMGTLSWLVWQRLGY
jgi:prepilin peptidase CpaA